MQPLVIRYLLLSSCIVLCMACTNEYKSLRAATGDAACVEKFRPDFTAQLYKANIAVSGKSLSGLLLVKKMPDSSTRLLFSTETGFKFFDFEFSNDGKFKVYSIIKQMNKKPVIKTLRKDFELIMMNDTGNKNVQIRKDDKLLYYSFKQSKGYYHYITSISGEELIRAERASKRKAVMEAIMKNYTNGIPDSIGITHKNFNFTIGLKRIIR